MPSRGMINYMYQMTQIGATPNEIETGLSQYANVTLIFCITAVALLLISVSYNKLAKK